MDEVQANVSEQSVSLSIIGTVFIHLCCRDLARDNLRLTWPPWPRHQPLIASLCWTLGWAGLGWAGLGWMNV